jgi:hypothetical protein
VTQAARDSRKQREELLLRMNQEREEVKNTLVAERQQNAAAKRDLENDLRTVNGLFVQADSKAAAASRELQALQSQYRELKQRFEMEEARARVRQAELETVSTQAQSSSIPVNPNPNRLPLTIRSGRTGPEQRRARPLRAAVRLQPLRGRECDHREGDRPVRFGSWLLSLFKR